MHRYLAILTVVALAACGAHAATSAVPSTTPTTAVATTAAADPTTAAADPATAATESTTAAASTAASTGAETTAADAVEPFGSLPDLAVVSADGRVAVGRAGSFTEPVPGLVAADGATVISTTVSADRSSTTVRWTGLVDATVVDEADLKGDLTAIATDPTGTVVALTGAGPSGAGSGTEIVITGRHGELFRESYSSELLPEGFTNFYDVSGELPAGLFVIEYLDPPPAEAGAPRRYRVRVVDTATGDLALPRNLRDKTQTVDEEMLGFGRTHVLSRANGLLFTLYRGLDEDEAGYAFVHTLGFVNGVWCLDLPIDLDLGALPGAIVLVEHEAKLFVASANGYMTEFVVDDIANSPTDPAPFRTESVWKAPGSTEVPALASSGAALLVGQGAHLRWVDAETLTVTSELTWDMTIEAVSLMPDGTALAAGTRRISAITPSGDLVGELPLPDGFGAVARIVVLDQN